MERAQPYPHGHCHPRCRARTFRSSLALLSVISGSSKVSAVDHVLGVPCCSDPHWTSPSGKRSSLRPAGSLRSRPATALHYWPNSFRQPRAVYAFGLLLSSHGAIGPFHGLCVVRGRAHGPSMAAQQKAGRSKWGMLVRRESGIRHAFTMLIHKSLIIGRRACLAGRAVPVVRLVGEWQEKDMPERTTGACGSYHVTGSTATTVGWASCRPAASFRGSGCRYTSSRRAIGLYGEPLSGIVHNALVISPDSSSVQ